MSSNVRDVDRDKVVQITAVGTRPPVRHLRAPVLFVCHPPYQCWRVFVFIVFHCGFPVIFLPFLFSALLSPWTIYSCKVVRHNKRFEYHLNYVDRVFIWSKTCAIWTEIQSFWQVFQARMTLCGHQFSGGPETERHRLYHCKEGKNQRLQMADEGRAIEQTTGAGCKCDGRCWLWERRIVSFLGAGHTGWVTNHEQLLKVRSAGSPKGSEAWNRNPRSCRGRNAVDWLLEGDRQQVCGFWLVSLKCHVTAVDWCCTASLGMWNSHTILRVQTVQRCTRSNQTHFLFQSTNCLTPPHVLSTSLQLQRGAHAFGFTSASVTSQEELTCSRCGVWTEVNQRVFQRSRGVQLCAMSSVTSPRVNHGCEQLMRWMTVLRLYRQRHIFERKHTRVTPCTHCTWRTISSALGQVSCPPAFVITWFVAQSTTLYGWGNRQVSS